MRHINYLLGNVNCLTFTILGCICLYYHVWLGAAVCFGGFIFAAWMLMKATNAPR